MDAARDSCAAAGHLGSVLTWVSSAVRLGASRLAGAGLAYKCAGHLPPVCQRIRPMTAGRGGMLFPRTDNAQQLRS